MRPIKHRLVSNARLTEKQIEEFFAAINAARERATRRPQRHAADDYSVH